MKARTTLLLLAVAAAVFFGITYFEKDNPTTRKSEEQAAEVLPGLDRSKLTAIEIRNGENAVTLEKEKDAWFLDVPVRDRADMGAVTRLLTSLESLSSKARLEDVSKEKIKEFGLDKPSLRVKFEGEDQPERLSIGDDTAVGQGNAFYARTEDRDTVFVIEGDLKQQLSQKPTDFRDRRLMSQRVGEADRMVIHLGSGEIEVKRSADQWSLEKPFKARGDAQKIRDIIASLTNARIDTFVGDAREREDDGLAEPAGSVDLYFNGQDEPETIKFGRTSTAKPEETYVSLSSRIGVFQVSKDVAGVLEERPSDLRDRSLVRINPDIVDRITLTRRPGTAVQLARKEEDWLIRSSDNRPANGAEVLQFIDRLRNYQVKDFVAESASELEKYGLAKPVLTVAFSSYASANTAESAAGENEITRILFGKSKDGSSAFAKIEEEPFIVSVEPALLEDIPTSAAAWRSPVVTDFDPATIASVELQKTGSEPVILTRQENAWTTSTGEAGSVAAQSLANTLAKLRAVRWIGDVSPDQGLSDPVLTVTMKRSEKSETLLVGNATPDNMHFAQFKDDPGVFLISDPDFQTLVAAFPAPAALPPSTSATPE